MDKTARKYRNIFKKALLCGQSEAEQKAVRYVQRLEAMYASDIFREHNIYPSMHVDKVYAVIAMCLELKEYGLSDTEITDFADRAFALQRKPLKILLGGIDLLPNCFQIARKWNLSDHDSRTRDGSLLYSSFEATADKIEYTVSKCMYAEMFQYYGIRSLCKIFCLTDVFAYEQLPRHVRFIRHSDLSDGSCCHDEVIRRRAFSPHRTDSGG